MSCSFVYWSFNVSMLGGVSLSGHWTLVPLAAPGPSVGAPTAPEALAGPDDLDLEVEFQPEPGAIGGQDRQVQGEPEGEAGAVAE